MMWPSIKSTLFRLDAERAHDMAMAALRTSAKLRGPLPGRDHPSQNDRLARTAFGLSFKNPLGIAAGFDKNAEVIPALSRLGFGFVEVGTLTWHPQPGNDKPRLFRLVDDRALMNRLGFNNEGAETAARRIEAWRNKDKVKVPLGVNIGKSKITPLVDAPTDYASSLRVLRDLADYLVINVSSPNTPGLRELQSVDALHRVLDAVMHDAGDVPVFVKFAPDMDDSDAIASARAAKERGVTGLVLTNTTTSRAGLKGEVPAGSGGVSGAPLMARSTALLRTVRQAVPELVYIGVGGVMNAGDAKAKLEAGATLVQAYTGFIYGGPSFVSDVCAAL